MNDITAKLAAPFPANVVSWRVGPTTKDKAKGMALAYIDARDVMNRLDEACGPFGWQSRHETDGKKVTCHIGIRAPEGEWVWKSDGAGETDTEGEKGSYSDSLKRAAVSWGVGRYLYDVDSPWVPIEARGSSYVLPETSLHTLRQTLQRIPGTPASRIRPTPSTGGEELTGTGSTTPTTERKTATPEESAAARQKLMGLMAKATTRTSLRTWADGAKVQAAIEGLTDKDGAMFAAEFKKRWEALPESLAMAG